MCTLASHSGPVNGVAVTRDGRVVSASADHTLKIWKLRDRARPAHPRQPLRPSQWRGSYINRAGCPSFRRSHAQPVVWDLDTGSQVRTLSGHTSLVNGVAVTPDGRRAISASGDKTLKVWELETGSAIATFVCDSPLRCCACGNDLAVVVGDDAGHVHFFSLEL